jgi:(R,R)-butanediol dehydrogenase / meso-butanediol dehydrogenase / diacetyl reductase
MNIWPARSLSLLAHPLTGHSGKTILGHEFTGTVVAVGAGVTNVKVGDLVAPDACQHCGECLPCRLGRYNVCEKLAFTGLMADGAFAKYVNVPSNICYVLPPKVSMPRSRCSHRTAGHRLQSRAPGRQHAG